MTSTIDRDDVTATVQPLGLELDVRDYSITLDDSRAPYVEARLTCAAPAEATLEALDPRESLRVSIVLDRQVLRPSASSQTRTLDLYLHSRVLNAGDATVELVCRSDEAILIDTMLGGTVVDTRAEDVQGSLREVVDLVLGDFGAELEPGGPDADYTITWNTTNLVRNPRLAVAATDWAGSSQGVFTRESGGLGGSPMGVLTISTAASGEPYVICSAAGTIPVAPGRAYSIGLYVKVSAAVAVHLRYVWIDSAGAVVGAVNLGDAVAVVAETWTRLTLEALVAPAGAARLSVGVSGGAAVSWPVGRTLAATRAIVVDDAEVPAYFDGGGAYPADTHYTYSWSGTAHASPSSRTRIDSRARDVLRWSPGVKAWDFLAPLVDAAGLRLFCDEQRRWRMVDPVEYTVPGQVRVSDGWNATSALDTIDLSAADRGEPGYVATVVVKYTWIDRDGVQRTAYDAAGELAGIGRLVELNRPYPGPGMAAALLTRWEGKGRILDLGALVNLTATPGQELVAIFPGAPTQLGITSAVEWRSDGTMRVGSRGLASYLPGAIGLLAGTIDDLIGTIDDL